MRRRAEQWAACGGRTPQSVDSRVAATENAGRDDGRPVAARDVRAGDAVLLRSGRTAKVGAVSSAAARCTVYNFEVRDLHTYAVGADGVLVHNSKDCLGLDSEPLETSRAARRQAMRDAGTPTSRPATSQSGSGNRRQYVTEGSDGRPRVQTQHPADADHSNPHWHDAKPRVDENRDLVRNRYNQVKYEKGGTVREYRD